MVNVATFLTIKLSVDYPTAHKKRYREDNISVSFFNPKTMENTTLEEKEKKIKELQDQKVALLDKYGIFGGGQYVNMLHQRINKKLEELGVDENS